MENIHNLEIGQRVQLDGEQGVIKEIDYEEHVVWVTVPLPDGDTSVDVSPDEPWFEVIK